MPAPIIATLILDTIDSLHYANSEFSRNWPVDLSVEHIIFYLASREDADCAPSLRYNPRAARGVFHALGN